MNDIASNYNISSRLNEELGEDLVIKLRDFFNRGDDKLFFHNLQLFFFKKEAFTFMRVGAMFYELGSDFNEIQENERSKHILSRIAGKILDICLGITKAKEEQLIGQERIIRILQLLIRKCNTKQNSEVIAGHKITNLITECCNMVDWD